MMKPFENYTEENDCVVFTGRIPPHEIAFVNALIDDMANMAVVRTEDNTIGKMEFWVTPAMADDFTLFFESIRKQTGIEMTLGEPIPKSSEMIRFLEKPGE